MEKMSEDAAQKLEEEIMPHVREIAQSIEENTETEHDASHMLLVVLTRLYNEIAENTGICGYSAVSAYQITANKVTGAINGFLQKGHVQNQNDNPGYIG